MAKENEVTENQPTSVEEARVAHSAKLDTLVAANKARSRRHAQFLVNAGALKLP